MSKSTPIKMHIAAGASTLALDAADVRHYADLADIGIKLNAGDVREMAAAFGMDSVQGGILPTTSATPIQFLQNWLPGLVRTLTTARRIDELVGVSIGGEWSDEEVIQQVLEPVGSAVPYGDHTNVPLASWNPGFERRTVVRFELGFEIGRLEDARGDRTPNINNASEKRGAVAQALEIARNRVGFAGYIGGAGRTFGMLNDPGLPAYATVPTAGAGTVWSGKTFLQITADIREAAAALQARSGDNIDPERDDTVLALASNVVQYLTVTSDFGNSVRQWLRETYPKMRIVSVPEFNAANGGANVFYLYAERVEDGSTDGGRTFEQIVPAKFQSLGVEQRAKSYLEDFTNALGGVMLKRPFAIVRRSGI